MLYIVVYVYIIITAINPYFRSHDNFVPKYVLKLLYFGVSTIIRQLSVFAWPHVSADYVNLNDLLP